MIARPGLALPALLLAVLAIHLGWMKSSEPYFSGDETRHVMTGVFVHDAIRDGAIRDPRAYAERYYAQYPCLGLLVWPPGFYIVEGMAMLAFGPYHEVARGLVLAYLTVALVYFFRFVHRTHGETTATVAVMILALSREVFVNSRAVMLEVPTLACALGAMFHFERYIAERRPRDLLLLAIWTVAAGLHRYDAIFLAPYFGIRLVMVGKLSLIRSRSVIVTGAAILAGLAPVYWLAYLTVGQQHALATGSGSNPDVVRHGTERFTYYILSLDFQLGLVTTIAGVVGLWLSIRSDRFRSRPYWALALIVYLCFAALAEQETRHTIYWLPAWCVWAAEAALAPIRKSGRRWWTLAIVAFVVGSAGCWTLRQPVPWVRGYSDAAEFVSSKIDGPGVVIFDGHFDGTFIYALRARDPDRQLWVVRGDKLLYAVRSDPGAGYIEWAKSDEAILTALLELAPEYIIVEDPPLKYELPAQTALRRVLRERKNRFERIDRLPIRNNNIEWMDGAGLLIYRSQFQSETRRTIRIPMLWGGRDLTVELPGR
jgi:hypothetical protein